MRRLQRINDWCVACAGVTLWQWIGYSTAFAVGIVGIGMIAGMLPR